MGSHVVGGKKSDQLIENSARIYGVNTLVLTFLQISKILVVLRYMKPIKVRYMYVRNISYLAEKYRNIVTIPVRAR